MQPLRPHQVQEIQKASIPPEVIHAFNVLLIKNLKGKSATIYQDDVVKAIMENVGCERDEVFERGYLDIEKLFASHGWHVEYDKPGYNESYGAFFRFRALDRD